MSEPITNVEDAVREHGALPVPAGPGPVPVGERVRRAAELADVQALATEWGLEAEELRTRVAELEAAAYVAPSPSCARCYGADAARFVAKGGPTTPCRVCGPSQVEQLEARVAELEAQREADHKTWQHDLRTARDEREATAVRIAELEAERHVTNEALDDAVKALRVHQVEREALVERMRAGQRWQRGRNPELVSENLISQSELREIFGIPLVAPWDESGSVEADGIARRIVPVLALREDEPAEAPYVSRLLPPRDAVCSRPECGHSGAEHHHGDTKCWAHLPREHGEAIAICGCSGFVPGSGGA